MSRPASVAAMLSLTLLAAACSGPAATSRPRPTLGLAPGVAQFLASSRLTLTKSQDGTIQIGGAVPVAGSTPSPAFAPATVRVARDGGMRGTMTEAILYRSCRLPDPPRAWTSRPPVATGASGVSIVGR